MPLIPSDFSVEKLLSLPVPLQHGLCFLMPAPQVSPLQASPLPQGMGWSFVLQLGGGWVGAPASWSCLLLRRDPTQNLLPF